MANINIISFNDEEVIKNSFAKTKRKPISICYSNQHGLTALCDDGTIWYYLNDDLTSETWIQLHKIPQD